MNNSIFLAREKGEGSQKVWYTASMKKQFPPKKIYIAQSKIIPTERGVFASTFVKKGELIEKCPVIAISEHDTANISEESLVTYMYYFGEKKERSAVALGFGSIYNHTDTPNALYKEKYQEQIIEFWAIRDIKKDEEITVSYAKENKNMKRKLWFITPSAS